MFVLGCSQHLTVESLRNGAAGAVGIWYDLVEIVVWVQYLLGLDLSASSCSRQNLVISFCRSPFPAKPDDGKLPLSWRFLNAVF